MNDEEVYNMIKTVLETFPFAPVSGYRILRIVDQDTFLDAIKKILIERKPEGEP